MSNIEARSSYSPKFGCQRCVGGGGKNQSNICSFVFNLSLFYFRDSTYTPPPPPSVFRESTLSPAEIANQLRDELKRMRRRRQIVHDDITSRHSPSPPMLASPYSPSEFVMDSSSVGCNDAPTSIAGLQRRHLLQQHQQQQQQQQQQQHQQQQPTDKPVFTLKQMTLICERMCKVIQ